jgi:hypothetical protein
VIPKPKTHYEQVPLEVVKKIAEEEDTLDKTTEQLPGTKKSKLRENLLEGAAAAGRREKS